jgi:hypothetical protein
MRGQFLTAVIGTFALFSVVACGDDGGSTSTAPQTTAAENKDAADLPNLVGKGLQSAQDAAQDAGFFNLMSHDSLGRGRTQIQDRNWRVCFQTPKAGKHSTETRVDLGAVQLEERCPANDAAIPNTGGTEMPRLTGKSVKVARLSLDTSTSMSVKDASGEDRAILVESNWKVCSQDPKPGAKLTGQPVSLTAVKFEEACP